LANTGSISKFSTRINIKLNDRAQSVSQRFKGSMLAEAAAIIRY